MRDGHNRGQQADEGAPSVLPAAESAEEENDKTDQEHKAQAAAAVRRTADIKAAAAEEENKNDDQEEWVHDAEPSSKPAAALWGITRPPRSGAPQLSAISFQQSAIEKAKRRI
jgi:hypothetical protein